MIVSGHSAEGLGLRRPLDGPVAPSTAPRRNFCFHAMVLRGNRTLSTRPVR